MNESENPASTVPPPEPEPVEAEEEGDRALCLHCATPNHPLAPYCVQCGRTIGDFAATDPIRQIYSEGQAWRVAAAGVPKRIAVVGIWLIFGPMAVLSALFVFAMRDHLPYGTGLVGRAGWLLLYGGLGAFAIAVIWRTTLNYGRACRYQKGVCGSCAAELGTAVEGCCGECGRPIPQKWLVSAEE